MTNRSLSEVRLAIFCIHDFESIASVLRIVAFILSSATTQWPHTVKTLWIAPNFVDTSDGLLLAGCCIHGPKKTKTISA
ncbi:hypothetical protein PS691_04155 [Pseudomonas fluorescens]|uniref:Uncharacterized protein n=1 Tax=Pseudomonas fluorescens TaxID=294 RepID=A0A5E7E4B7_PSEFL|nr:hypothetical protein PS691_04155 [Pseudomonas fluorescens]